MGHLDPCETSARIFSGRSSVAGGKGLHLWGAVAPITGLQSAYVEAGAGFQIFNDCPKSPGLWQITSAVAEYVRQSGEGSLLPLDETALTQTPVGVQPSHRRTQIQLRVNASDGTSGRMFDMDANQSITVVAQSVCVDWLGPPGTLDVQYFTAAQRAAVPLTGMVVDSFLGVSLSRIEESPGENSTAVLTRHLYVPAATRGSIQIPPYAQEVTIYQAPTLGISSVMWTQTYGDPNGLSGSMAIGALPFIVGQRRTQQESTIPNASHLWTDIDPDTDRFYTLSFTIRP